MKRAKITMIFIRKILALINVKPMTYSLDQLSENEHQIYSEAGYQQKNTGVRIIDTSDTWLLKDYEAIYNEYLDLYEESDSEEIKLEALKRMIFLNWNYKLEPDWFTGIKKLNNESIYKSYSILNNYIELQKLDTELNWMLSFYSSWEYIIHEYSKINLFALTNFVNSVDTSIINFPKNMLPKGTMDNRGQMGIYWKKFVEKE